MGEREGCKTGFKGPRSKKEASLRPPHPSSYHHGSRKMMGSRERERERETETERGEREREREATSLIEKSDGKIFVLLTHALSANAIVAVVFCPVVHCCVMSEKEEGID